MKKYKSQSELSKFTDANIELETMIDMLEMPTIWNLVPSKYQLLSKIGQGSFGKVYKAIDILSGKFVAVKYVQCNTENQYEIACTIREISILR